jgi:indolepyruvate ferredoxin oxidoreductase beta subunit
MAIMAMGGEGGGVLSDWTISLAEENGYYAQSTSVPGVAQRTGATIYYVELFPKESNGARNPEPVLGTMPTPGEVDIVVASELMEGGRAISRGFVTPDRTTLISSTSRTYSMSERTASGDARVDSQGIIDAALVSSTTFLRGDFSKIADDSRSVISAVLFGALAGAAVLPFSREQFEDAIRSGGKGVETSLKAFDGGYASAVASITPPVSISIGMRPPAAELPSDGSPDPALVALATADPAALVGKKLQAQAQRIVNEFPVAARYMLVHGIKRTAEYQDVKYADEYLDRVASLLPYETDFDGDALLTVETARYTALWMTYEDTIRVAFHKVRARRFARVNKESQVAEDQIMQVHEYLHPQMEEIADTLPTALGRWFLNSKLMNKIVYRITHRGLKIATTSLWGFTLLYILARLKPIRRRSLRFGQEQQRIDGWLAIVRLYAPENYQLALQMVICQQVVKGYGDTHANGMKNFNKLMASVAGLSQQDDSPAKLTRLMTAALADESGNALEAALAK